MSSKFKNIVEAVKAIRDRGVTPSGTVTKDTNGRDVLWVKILNPTLKEDKDLVLQIMALGVDLYKIEKNITD